MKKFIFLLCFFLLPSLSYGSEVENFVYGTLTSSVANDASTLAITLGTNSATPTVGRTIRIRLFVWMYGHRSGILSRWGARSDPEDCAL